MYVYLICADVYRRRCRCCRCVVGAADAVAAAFGVADVVSAAGVVSAGVGAAFGLPSGFDFGF